MVTQVAVHYPFNDQAVEAEIKKGFAVIDDIGSGTHVFKTTATVVKRERV